MDADATPEPLPEPARARRARRPAAGAIGLTVTVLGATGFVGRHLVRRLAERGHRVRALSRSGRGRSEWSASVTPMRGDVETGVGLEEAMRGADAAVHLVAIPRPARGRTLVGVNVVGTRNAVVAASRAGVRRFVHVSVIGAAGDPELEFLSSKWRGERIVCSSDLDWVVFRPSIMFGPGDGFFSLVRTALRWSPGVIAIPGDGHTRFQPLAVDDLADAIERAVVEPQRSRQLYEVGGPEQLTYEEIVERVIDATGVRRAKLHVPVPLLSAATAVTDRLVPFFPVTNDQIKSLAIDNVTALDSFERHFGRQPRRIDLSYLRNGPR
jgi:uncharacterized protein YbjT (DUF2867 family)